MRDKKIKENIKSMLNNKIIIYKSSFYLSTNIINVSLSYPESFCL